MGSDSGTLSTLHCLVEKSRKNPDSKRIWTFFGQSAIIPKYEGCVEKENKSKHRGMKRI